METGRLGSLEIYGSANRLLRADQEKCFHSLELIGFGLCSRGGDGVHRALISEREPGEPNRHLSCDHSAANTNELCQKKRKRNNVRLIIHFEACVASA